MVYLIHFEEKYFHAQHYIGFTERQDVEERVKEHRLGTGSHLLKAVVKAGIEFRVVRTWKGGTRFFERKLKNCKNSKRFCPICNPEKYKL